MNPNDYPVYPEDDGYDRLEILTALFKQLYIVLAVFGAGMGGIPLTFEDIKDL